MRAIVEVILLISLLAGCSIQFSFNVPVNGQIGFSQRGQISLVQKLENRIEQRLYDYRGVIRSRITYPLANAMDTYGRIWKDSSVTDENATLYRKFDCDIIESASRVEVITKQNRWSINIPFTNRAIAVDSSVGLIYVSIFNLVQGNENVKLITYDIFGNPKGDGFFAKGEDGSVLTPSSLDRSIASVDKDLVAFVALDEKCAHSHHHAPSKDGFLIECIALYLSRPSSGISIPIFKETIKVGHDFASSGGHIVAEPGGARVFFHSEGKIHVISVDPRKLGALKVREQALSVSLW